MPPSKRTNDRRRQWRGSHIKCLPYVEAAVYDRQGAHARDRSVEEMLHLFRKLVNKSGVMDELQERRSYTKPSTERRAKRLEREYENDKRVAREKEAKRLRGDSR